MASLLLGVGNAHFFLATNGKFRYILKGNYDAPKEVMADLRNGDVEVCYATLLVQPKNDQY